MNQLQSHDEQIRAQVEQKMEDDRRFTEWLKDYATYRNWDWKTFSHMIDNGLVDMEYLTEKMEEETS